MKKIMFLVIFLVGCSVFEKDNSESVTFIIDETDTLQGVETLGAEGIFNALSISRDKWCSESVRFAFITDFRKNRTVNLSLPAENSIMGNEINRLDTIGALKNNIKGIVQAIQKSSKGRNRSFVFETIANELNKLSELSSSSKKLFVFSDLFETEVFNSYDSCKLDIYRLQPSSFKALLDKTCALENIHGIEITFVYQPNNHREDYRFYLISELYTNYLIEKGAVVNVKATFNE